MIKGGCYCGNIRFEVVGEVSPVVSCHCSQCRKISGHYVAASRADNDRLSISGEVKWFESSKGYQRGFCPNCGTQLFWQKLSEPKTSIMAGAFDEGTMLEGGEHIFVQDKADYYEICEAKR